MESIRKRLDTIPKAKKQEFWNIVDDMLKLLSPTKELDSDDFSRYKSNPSKEEQEIRDKAKTQIMQSLSTEYKEILSKRKHGSKGKKHRERARPYMENIEKKIRANDINYPLLFKELFDVELREKRSENGIGYIGLCPYHEEKTPSVSIYPHKGLVRCFGCGQGGLAITFLQKTLMKRYFQVLSILEPYINSPEEHTVWKEKDLAVRKEYEPLREWRSKRREFGRRLTKEDSDRPKLSTKEFNKRFEEWQTQKEESKNETVSDDDYPF